MKEFCIYDVVDEFSGYVLATGRKWKDVSKLLAGPTFQIGFFRKRTIRTYYDQAWIGDRPAVVVFWAGGKKKGAVQSVVSAIGGMWNLKGTYYDESGPIEVATFHVKDYRKRYNKAYRKSADIVIHLPNGEKHYYDSKRMESDE